MVKNIGQRRRRSTGTGSGRIVEFAPDNDASQPSHDAQSHKNQFKKKFNKRQRRISDPSETERVIEPVIPSFENNEGSDSAKFANTNRTPKEPHQDNTLRQKSRRSRSRSHHRGHSHDSDRKLASPSAQASVPDNDQAARKPTDSKMESKDMSQNDSNRRDAENNFHSRSNSRPRQSRSRSPLLADSESPRQNRSSRNDQFTSRTRSSRSRSARRSISPSYRRGRSREDYYHSQSYRGDYEDYRQNDPYADDYHRKYYDQDYYRGRNYPTRAYHERYSCDRQRDYAPYEIYSRQYVVMPPKHGYGNAHADHHSGREEYYRDSYADRETRASSRASSRGRRARSRSPRMKMRDHRDLPAWMQQEDAGNLATDEKTSRDRVSMSRNTNERRERSRSLSRQPRIDEAAGYRDAPAQQNDRYHGRRNYSGHRSPHVDDNLRDQSSHRYNRDLSRNEAPNDRDDSRWQNKSRSGGKAQEFRGDGRRNYRRYDDRREGYHNTKERSRRSMSPRREYPRGRKFPRDQEVNELDAPTTFMRQPFPFERDTNRSVYQLDTQTGYFYDPQLRFYYDARAKLYLDVDSGSYMAYDPQARLYATWNPPVPEVEPTQPQWQQPVSGGPNYQASVTAQPNVAEVPGVVDATAPQHICYICARAFASKEQLVKHEQKSKLHQENLAKMNSQK